MTTKISISTVDFKQYTSNSSNFGEEDIKNLAKELYDAFKGVGCVVLKNCGVTDSETRTAFSRMKEFFTMDVEVKSKYAGGDLENIPGWRKEGAEGLDEANKGLADIKETFDVVPSQMKKWPTEVNMFQEEITSLYSKSENLAKTIMELLAIALDLEDKDFFTKLHHPGAENNMTTLRSAYYPALTTRKEGTKPNQQWCGEHKDFSSVTLIYEDAGGLQIKLPDGSYEQATSDQDSVFILCGEYTEIWTAGRIISPMHRVVNPNPSITRQSAVFFYHPDNDTMLKCLDGSDTYKPIRLSQFYENHFDYRLDKD